MQNEGIDDFNDAFEVTMGVNARPSTSSGVRGNSHVKAVSSAVGNSNTVHNNININNNVAVDSDNKKSNRYNNQGSNFTEDIEDKTNANNVLKTPSVTTSVTASKKTRTARTNRWWQPEDAEWITGIHQIADRQWEDGLWTDRFGERRQSLDAVYSVINWELLDGQLGTAEWVGVSFVPKVSPYHRS